MKLVRLILLLVVATAAQACERSADELPFEKRSWMAARQNDPARANMMPAVKRFLDQNPLRGEVTSKLGNAQISTPEGDYWWILLEPGEGGFSKMDGLRVHYDAENRVDAYAYPVRYPVEKLLGR